MCVLLFTAIGLKRRHAFVQVLSRWLELNTDLGSLKALSTHRADVLHILLCLSAIISLLVPGIEQWAQLKYMDTGVAASLFLAVSQCFNFYIVKQ
jgi:hypothetical protein